MNNQIPPSTSASKVLPSAWLAITNAQLALSPLLPAEIIHGCLEINLDNQLYFKKQLLVISNQRLLCFHDIHHASSENLTAYGYHANLKLQRHDHAGVGKIELFDGEIRLAVWFYTLAQDIVAARFIKQFKQQLTSFISGLPVPIESAEICPNCQTALSTDDDECPQCNSTIDSPPSTWTLFRLWRFAKPYQWQLLAGFLLMLASTAATLVPPYLTIPLMDKVLIPYQNLSLIHI